MGPEDFMARPVTPQKFLKVYATWERNLPSFTDAQFAWKANDGSWSMGQVYMHLFGSAKTYHLAQVEKCLASNENAEKKKAFPGRLTFFLGSMPPMKIKVPAATPGYTPLQPTGKAAVKILMEEVKSRMIKTAELLNRSHSKGKTPHRAFGYLNAREWYALIEMHLRHHLAQKRRLEVAFR